MAEVKVVGILLNDLVPGEWLHARLEDGRQVKIIVPLLGFDLKQPPPLKKGTKVLLSYDGFEDAYWCHKVIELPQNEAPVVEWAKD